MVIGTKKVDEYDNCDIHVVIDKILPPNEISCYVTGCMNNDLFSISFEKPENVGCAGGVYCTHHLKCIYGINLEGVKV